MCEFCKVTEKPCKECYDEDNNEKRYPVYHAKRHSGLVMTYHEIDNRFYLRDFEFGAYSTPIKYCPWCSRELRRHEDMLH